MSQDTEKGNSQKSGSFWQSVKDYYNQLCPRGAVKRDSAKLKSIWSQVRTKVTEFCEIYNKLQNMHPSGCNDAYILLHVEEEY